MAQFFNAVCKDEYSLKGKEILTPGEAEGILWGGNLSTVSSLCGEDFILDSPFLFMAEDLNEPAYKIDKMITQLLNIKEFSKNIKALILGDFLNVDNKNWLDDLFKEVSEELKIPAVKGFRLTHLRRKDTFPIGMCAKLKNLGIIIQ